VFDHNETILNQVCDKICAHRILVSTIVQSTDCQILTDRIRYDSTRSENDLENYRLDGEGMVGGDDQVLTAGEQPKGALHNLMVFGFHMSSRRAANRRTAFGEIHC
jgi:hypothetical protein